MERHDACGIQRCVTGHSADVDVDLVGSDASAAITIEFYLSPNTNYLFSGIPDAGLDMHRIAVTSAISDSGDLIVGGAGADILYGQGGNDVLIGRGYDPATGTVTRNALPAGNVFCYTMQADNGSDVIKDFRVGVDRIALIDVLDANPAGSRTPRFLNDPDLTTSAYGDRNLSAADLSVANGQPGAPTLGILPA